MLPKLTTLYGCKELTEFHISKMLLSLIYQIGDTLLNDIFCHYGLIRA